jgi:hypothetical protein
MDHITLQHRLHLEGDVSLEASDLLAHCVMPPIRDDEQQKLHLTKDS